MPTLKVTGKKIPLRDQHLTAVNLTNAETLTLLKLAEGDAVIQINETVFLDDGVSCEVNVAIINTRHSPLKQNSQRP